jgi:hypothetical protein
MSSVQLDGVRRDHETQYAVGEPCHCFAVLGETVLITCERLEEHCFSKEVAPPDVSIVVSTATSPMKIWRPTTIWPGAS